MSDSKAVRVSRLCDEIGFALGRGEFPEDQINEFRWLWRTTPNQEKEGWSINLQDIEQMIKDMRREKASQTSGFLQRVPVEFTRPAIDETI